MNIVTRNNIIGVVIAAVVLFVLFSAPQRVRKYYPNDETHNTAATSKSRRNMHEACGVCHFEDGEYPIPETHLKRTRCYGCHSAKPAEGAEE